MIRVAAVSVAILAAFVGGVWGGYCWIYPYGWSHCCDKQLWLALQNYADQHEGRFPAGGATAEASLGLLYPDVAAELLCGKTVPIEKCREAWERQGHLDEQSCDWHYVAGLTRKDDGRLALFWDKVGLGHNGERLSQGGHSVFFVDGDHGVVPADEWPSFLDEQAKLLAARKSAGPSQPKSGP